jgi:asparagine synthase (glutamine-hydrolysing)
MCGIAGGVGPSAPSLQALQAQLTKLEHRGPDDRGTYVNQGISLGMCRLAIVEIAAGIQPFESADDKIKIVFNGEIYNYRQLRTELVALGHEFAGASESEVIIAAYRQFGPDFPNHLSGMFAIALFDQANDALVLVRDRVGKKPLWFSKRADGSILFASEVKALLAALPNRTLRKGVVAEVMQFGYVNAPNSAFTEIRQLPPATMAIWHHGDWSMRTYWQPDYETEIQISYKDALVETKNKIEAAVERRLMSERPMGAFLSGGYDSTVVTALMAKLSSQTVKTYSIGFENPQYNEAEYAGAVAKHLGTDHHQEIVKPDPALILQELAASLDQPFADSSYIPTYLLAKYARQEVIVALGGDGGDEVFGGYDRYVAAPLMQRANYILSIAKPIAAVMSKSGVVSDRKMKRIISQLQAHPSLAARYTSIMSLTQPSQISRLLKPEFNLAGANEIYINDFKRAGARDSLHAMIRSDFEYYLPGDLLVKADLATMANSLELRSPLLDHDVIEWANSLPAKFKVAGRESKHILKDIARTLVPAELIDRPKMGFAIPRADWLRNELRQITHDLLTDEVARSRGWFDQHEIHKILSEHQSGQDRDSIIWPALCLELWARNWL